MADERWKQIDGFADYGIPVRDLLKVYGVDKTTAYRLKSGATWKHIHQELGG